MNRLFFINNASKTIKDRSKLTTIDVEMKGRYPYYILEAVAAKCRHNKYKTDWFTDSSLFVQMKHCSVKIRKI